MRYKKWNHEINSYIKWAILTLLFVVILNQTVIINAVIPSESMQPIIMKGDRIIGNRLAYLFQEPERKDIIIFYAPDLEKTLYVKRILGMPGDQIKIQSGKIYINEELMPLEEPYLCEEMNVEETMIFLVPEESYFVLGDNRNHSNDSRFWNEPFVKRQDILGKVWMKYYKDPSFFVDDEAQLTFGRE